MSAKILIVEDEAITAMDLKNTLEILDFKVVSTASDGKEAIEKTEKLKPDLILMDIMLKGEIDGVETAEIIKRQFNVPIVYLTAHSDDETFERVKLTQPYGFLTKPFDQEGIRVSIETALYKHELDKKLKESEKKFQLLYQDAPLPYQSLNESGHISDVNQVWLDTLGYSRDEVIGKWFGDFLKTDYADKFMENFPKFKVKGEICNIEFEMKRKNGSIIIAEFNGKIGHDEQGNFQRTHCIFQDITKQKDAEKKLRESKERYKQFFDNPLNGFALCEIITDKRGEPIDFVYLKVNKAFEVFTGLKKEEVLNKRVTEILVHEEVADIIKIYGKVALTGESTQFEYLIPSLDKYYEIAAFSPRKNHFIALFTDITERKKSEEALMESEQRMNKSQEIAHIGSWELDLVNNYLFWSDEVYRIFGLKPQEFSATYEAFLEAIHPDDREAVDEAYSGSLREGRDTYEIEHRVIRKSTGEVRFVHEKCEHFRDESCQIIRSVGMVHDITERKQAEEEIKRHDKLLGSINRVLHGSLILETEEEVAGKCLEVAEELTGSKFGFLSEINPDGRLDALALSPSAWESFKIPPEKAHKMVTNMEIVSYWGRTIKEGKSQIVNNPESDPDRKGFPGEHPKITSFLGVPLKQSSSTIGMIGLANKEGVYTGEDAENIEALSTAFIEALMRKRAEIRLKESHDILEKKVKERTEELENAYESLKESEEKFRLIFNEAEDSIVLNEMMENGLPGKIIETNEVTSKRLGYTKEELLNMTPKEIIAPEKRFEMPKNAEKLRREGHAIFEIIHMAKDGRRIPVEVDNHIIDFKGKKTALTVIRDITNRKEMETQLKETINELERSNEELKTFAYVTSHDLQEPLRTISSYAGLLKRRYEGQLDSDADEFIEFMVDGAARMKNMIQSLLDYSRVGTKDSEFKEFNAEEALKQALSNLRSSIDECHAEVIYDLLPVIHADESQISRVFQNLMGNALKFRKEGVKPKIHISAKKEGKEWIFSVRDNGIGMEEQYTHKIFQVFRRLHTMDEYHGTGIGLAIVKKIIELHGGRVWVESESGKGSTFYFTIPIDESEKLVK